VIVVVGSLAWRELDPAGPAGRACEIALAVAAHGLAVEIVGRAGDDRAGDSLLIALSCAGVGHAAVLRDPVESTPIIAPSPEPDAVDDLFADLPGAVAQDIVGGPRLEPADVALRLSYLTALGVLVVTDDTPAEVIPACVAGAAFSGAHLVVLVPADRPLPDGLPPEATVIAAPDVADDGAFAALVGTFVAALDLGDEPAAAFKAATSETGWAGAEAPGSL
jgi:sugar/nucleoside kinase (ribokinase family)